MTQADVQAPRDMPLVSVVVATFNRAHLLARALESVLRQTYEVVEIVVVDDGSTDETTSVLADLAAAHPGQLTWVSKPNAGCASARNRGMELASGGFIAFLDSDDEWTPTAAQSLATVLMETGADFVYSPAVEIGTDGREWINHPVAAERPDEFAVEHFMQTNVRNGAFMFRREVLSVVGVLNEALGHNEDSDFVQRIALECRVAYSPDPTVRVHHHAGNKSRDRIAITTALIQSSSAVLARYPEFAEQLGDAAADRLNQLRVGHAMALARAARYEEANDLVRREQLNVPLLLRLALRSHSQLPFTVGGFGQVLRSRRK